MPQVYADVRVAASMTAINAKALSNYGDRQDGKLAFEVERLFQQRRVYTQAFFGKNVLLSSTHIEVTDSVSASHSSIHI